MAGRIDPSRRHGPLDPRFRKPLKYPAAAAAKSTADNVLVPGFVALASELSSWEGEGGTSMPRPPAVT